MKLTAEQDAVLKGERGAVLARYLKWSIVWGEAMGASRLIPVTNVHCILRTPCLPGLSDKALDSYFDEFRQLCQENVKCITLTHANCRDLAALREKGLREKELLFQPELQQLAQKAGIRTTWTCVPYQVGGMPSFGEICAWTESSAVVYANSMVGARTTRNGMESSLAAAFLGWIPEFGVLLDEHRKATVRVDVEVEMKSTTDWGALGYFAGELAGSQIPVFDQVEEISLEEAKQLSASLPYAGRGTAMFHMVGITPEASSLESAVEPDRQIERLVFDEKARRETYRKMNTMDEGEEIDTITLGCPFSSLEEMRQISEVLTNRSVAPGVSLLVCTARDTLTEARNLGYTETIEKAGATILCDICPGAQGHMRPRNFVFNSFKQAFYGRSALRSRTAVATLERCVEGAVTGRWMG